MPKNNYLRNEENHFVMRYFIELQYNGAAYCGWQRQPNVATVQQSIEEALAILLQQPIEVIGAGRTDTGVNASYYVAHFDVEHKIDDTSLIIYKVNYILHGDIAIRSICEVAPSAHARFDAVSREYRYYIEPRKNPFTRHTTWQYYVPLDVDKMNCAADKLLDYSDFTSFAKLNSNNKTNICKITHAHWTVDTQGVMCFRIVADRFLRNMVRSIVGTLVDVGRGRYSVSDFEEIIASRDLSRSSAGAPAQGLFLSDICYPLELFTPRAKE